MLFLPICDNWDGKVVAENDEWIFVEIQNSFSRQTTFFQKLLNALESGDYHNIRNICNNICGGPHIYIWNYKLPLFPNIVAIAKQPNSNSIMTKHTIVTMVENFIRNQQYYRTPKFENLEDNINCNIETLFWSIRLEQNGITYFLNNHYIPSNTVTINRSGNEIIITFSTSITHDNKPLVLIFDSNSEKILFYIDNLSPADATKIRWLQKLASFPQTNNVMSVRTGNYRIGGPVIEHLELGLTKMTIDEIINYFGYGGRRRGTKLDTFIECASTFADYHKSTIAQMVGEKIIISTQVRNPGTIPPNAIGSSTIMAILNNAKVLASLGSSQDNSKFLVEVTDTQSHDLANCLFSTLEGIGNNQYLSLYGHTVAQLDKTVEMLQLGA